MLQHFLRQSSEVLLCCGMSCTRVKCLSGLPHQTTLRYKRHEQNIPHISPAPRPCFERNVDYFMQCFPFGWAYSFKRATGYVLKWLELQREAFLPLGVLPEYSVMCNRYSNTNSEFLHKTLKSTTGNLTAKFSKSEFPLFVIAYVKMKLREPRATAAFVLRCYECTGGHLV
jgi:hypothetical protein